MLDYISIQLTWLLDPCLCLIRCVLSPNSLAISQVHSIQVIMIYDIRLFA